LSVFSFTPPSFIHTLQTYTICRVYNFKHTHNSFRCENKDGCVHETHSSMYFLYEKTTLSPVSLRLVAVISEQVRNRIKHAAAHVLFPPLLYSIHGRGMISLALAPLHKIPLLKEVVFCVTLSLPEIVTRLPTRFPRPTFIYKSRAVSSRKYRWTRLAVLCLQETCFAV